MFVVLELFYLIWTKLEYKEGNAVASFKRKLNKPTKSVKYQFCANSMTVNNHESIINNHITDKKKHKTMNKTTSKESSLNKNPVPRVESEEDDDEEEEEEDDDDGEDEDEDEE